MLILEQGIENKHRMSGSTAKIRNSVRPVCNTSRQTSSVPQEPGSTPRSRPSTVKGVWWPARLRHASASYALQQPENFDYDTSFFLKREAYNNMRASFVLASAMLSHSKEFLVRVLCAPIVQTRHDMCGMVKHTLNPSYCASSDDYKKYQALLLEFEESMYTFFGKCEDEGYGKYFRWSNTHIRDDNGKRVYWNQISAEYLEYYSSHDCIKPCDRKLGMDFHLACTLVHEFVHLVYHARKATGCLDPAELFDDEDLQGECLYHPSHSKAEFGFAWEYYVFGYRLSNGEKLRQKLGEDFFVKASDIVDDDPERQDNYVDIDVIRNMFKYT